MDVLVFLIPIALGLGALGLGAFLWSLKSGQYEDLEGAGWRVLNDDDLADGPTRLPGNPPRPRREDGDG